MSETVAEFMQKPVKKYACGKKAQSAKKVLAKAFVSSSKTDKAQEAAYFKEIVDTVMKTEKGRETMTALAELGYTFHFENMKDTKGFCIPGQKKILINPLPKGDIFAQMQALVHEGTHAIQCSFAKEDSLDFKRMKPVDYIKMKRAMEADASAHEMAYLYECGKTFSNDPRFQSMEFLDFWKNTAVYRAYAGEMEKSGDDTGAMKSAFSAWYKDDFYMNGYENLFKGEIRDICEKGKAEHDATFLTQSYPDKDILKMVCYKGKPYVGARDINAGVAFSLSEQNKREMEACIQEYAKAVGKKPDTSLSAMRERAADGKLLPEKKAVKAAIAAKSGRGGR